tara:strand:- start:21 stop:275 length:255 start_codon:yes stop_codon:yes gene_type:complete
MHGAILNGFLSHFVGMVMPGKKAVLLTSEIRHHSPCYLNDELLFKFMLKRKIESTRMLMLKFLVIRINEKKKVAYGKLQVLFKK